MKPIDKYIISAIVFVSLVAFIFWFLKDPVKEFRVNVPGQDNRPNKGSDTSEVIKIGENFVEYTSVNSGLAGKWTHFRGADFDNINKENIKLLDKWGKEGPKIAWKVDLGEGHAAPVVFNGKVYLLDYNEAKKSDALRCFSLETGKELWRRSYKVHIKRNHGMSRTIPAINEKYIVTIGPRCQVMCSNPQTGELLWGIDLVKEYKTEVPFWYTGQCPFIENDIAVIAPGGTSLLIGIDCATGKVVWKTPNPDNWKMSHSSVMPMIFNGKRMYVYAAVGGICGVSADGDDRGQILWKTTEFAPSVVAPSPLILDNGKILITAGYGAGSMLFQLIKNGESFNVKVLQKYRPLEGLASEQQTPIFMGGYIFSIQPKDAGGSRNQFICCKADDCKKILWTSGKTDRFGLGPYTVADGKFFILNDDGALTIAKATISGWAIMDKANIIEGQDSWGPIAIADGRLLMRTSKQMVCIDIREE
ncbi:MAG: PQQ-binding-like beta-propeller repeat protein [Bacteroidales bacterium]|nr:PQQ-binding-like beta-propeller repeat protein [Bacteroidales bacterium]